MGFISSRNLTDDGEIFDPQVDPIAQMLSEQQEEAEMPELDSNQSFIDLGSIQLPSKPGMNLGFLGERPSDTNAVEIVLGVGQMQLAAFAAPRSGGYWDEQLTEMREMFEQRGFELFPVPSEFGDALLVKPNPHSNDPEVAQAMPMLICGIEANRYLLRAVFRGAAAEDEAVRSPLAEVFNQTVVVRGKAPMAPGDQLPLKAPHGLTQIG